jgi:CRISPR-associated endonuclease Csn1
MAKILGLDLGTNSIGWALIDDVQNKILGIGSRKSWRRRRARNV